MTYSLIVQYPYETIQIALCQNGNIISSTTFHKFDATAKTIPTIIELLEAQGLKLSDISFFGINVGPGPYNTLRAILTMFNGIKRVNQVPLVTINALDLLQEEVTQKNCLIILNAFENHVFYTFNTDSDKQQGACSLADLEKIVAQQKNSMTIQGNGAIKYQSQLKTWKNIIWPQEIIPFNKLETLATLSFNKFQKHQYNDQYIKPIYFEDLISSRS